MTDRADSLTHEDSQKAEIERLRAEVACWRKNSVDAHAALTTMRNYINEYLPIPSLESDLLQGPETSVFCAVVANSVIAEILRFRAALAEARGLLEAFYRADIDPHKYDRTAKWLECNR